MGPLKLVKSIAMALGQAMGLAARKELAPPCFGRLRHWSLHQQHRLDLQAPVGFNSGDRPAQQACPWPGLRLGGRRQCWPQLGQQGPSRRLEPGLQRLQPHF